MQHYNLRQATNSFIGGSLHDLNTADSNPGEIDGIRDVDRDPVDEDSLDNDDESNSVVCVHDSYRSSIPLHGVGVDDDRSALENSGRSPSPSYNLLTQEDISPIATARSRFLQFVVDHFIDEHVIESGESSDVSCYQGNEKLGKRKEREVQYEGDPRFDLPLMYVANLYETLVNDVNVRLASLDGIREKNIGIALETAGGLYRRLAKKFPPKGPCSFRRRELATSLATRNRFPELVVQEEKRVRFVVVNGLSIIEKPSRINIDDVEWSLGLRRSTLPHSHGKSMGGLKYNLLDIRIANGYQTGVSGLLFKRLTGRHEVAISARDYKFYSPRHKYKRGAPHPMSNIPGLSVMSVTESSSPVPNAIGFRPVTGSQNHHEPSSKHHLQQSQQSSPFLPLHQAHHQSIQQNQHSTHFSHMCTHPSHVHDLTLQHQPQTMTPQLACMQSLSGGNLGERLHVLPTSPAKFCDECGTPYFRETSKFCSECGTKRLGV
ncbi:hypothetical protein ZIOFF_059202 [Zingiber officinale]|uniref:Zinc finger C2HC domain-containing protein n=1 Tax=Zingiber officinale TaxID=94328 RepID=A0A8J5FES9_ZINOF|nr:hypothetical protein ZIOFF_059202 [Zingiber officinale]